MAKTKLHIWIEDYHFDTLLITVEISWRKCFSFILKTLLHHRVRLFSNLLAVHYFYIVKPWSMSESKPLSKQVPKTNKSPPKREKDGFGPWADTKITWATHPTPPHPTHPITFKHEGVLW